MRFAAPYDGGEDPRMPSAIPYDGGEEPGMLFPVPGKGDEGPFTTPLCEVNAKREIARRRLCVTFFVNSLVIMSAAGVTT
jgi:hypothetical protein